ncbi:MAG: type II secretion system protein GspG [Nitrospirae bacterium RBG_13_39_12]|nr:MAG: type II secretion system protein GspG [Nitrospirae bacterium RBG_13_39_12]
MKIENEEVKKSSNQNGFTLIELIVVMVIIGILASIVYVKFTGKIGTSKHNAAKAQIEIFDQALELYRLDIGKYPTTSEGLNALVVDPGIEGWSGPYLKKAVPNDPWKRPYNYQSPGSHGDYDLFSYGADGSSGGDGESEDINSWE